MMKRTTIRDVAKQAGVSVSTVSRVMNNAPHITDKVKTRVLKVSAELGYTPNLIARRFRTGQTNAVSVLMPPIGTEFYVRLLEGVQGTLDGANIDMALFPMLNKVTLDRYRDPGALAYYADGLLITSLDIHQLFSGKRPSFSKPIVLLDAHHPKYHSVYFDNVAAGRMAAEYGLASGLPIAVIDAPIVPTNFSSPVFQERRSGIAQVLSEQGISPIRSVEATVSTEGGRQAADKLIAEGLPKQCMVLAACDDMAIGAMRQFSSHGWQLGVDIHFMGFDDSSAAERAGLTTIGQPAREMGVMAAQLMLDALQNKLTIIEQRCFAPRLIRRESA